MGDGCGKSFTLGKCCSWIFFAKPYGQSGQAPPLHPGGTLLAYGTRNSPHKLNIEHDTNRRLY